MTGETERTIEFELSADELVGLSRFHAPEGEERTPARSNGGLHRSDPAFPQTSTPAFKAARALRLGSWGIALALSAAVAFLVFGIAEEQISTSVEQPRSTAGELAADTATTETPSTSSSKPSPVRFANPFDPGEVFEFPPGTTPQSAREAVAEILLNRARDRHVRHEHGSRVRRGLRSS